MVGFPPKKWRFIEAHHYEELGFDSMFPSLGLLDLSTYVNMSLEKKDVISENHQVGDVELRSLNI
jgi:hypothetical protein